MIEDRINNCASLSITAARRLRACIAVHNFCNLILWLKDQPACRTDSADFLRFGPAQSMFEHCYILEVTPAVAVRVYLPRCTTI